MLVHCCSGGAELDEREAAVAEREAAVSEREIALSAQEAAVAEQRTKLAADLASSKARIDEANRMADDSMIVAVQHSQEKKAMAEEVRGGKGGGRSRWGAGGERT